MSKYANFLPGFFLILIFSPMLLACNEQNFKSVDHKDANGKLINRLYTFEPNQSPLLLLTDEDHNGTLEDTIYLAGKKSVPESYRSIYEEKRDQNGLVHTKLFFGPGAIKLVEYQDTNKDGFYEMRSYYNKNAIPKQTFGIIARIEYYSVNSSYPHSILYPFNRLEHFNEKGKPDSLVILSENAATCSQKLLIKKECIGASSNLLDKQSWYLHPELIINPENIATIPHSIPIL